MTNRPNPPASKRAREALAAEYDAHGYPGWGNRLRAGNFHEDMLAPLDAIDAATSQLLDEIEAQGRE